MVQVNVKKPSTKAVRNEFAKMKASEIAEDNHELRRVLVALLSLTDSEVKSFMRVYNVGTQIELNFDGKEKK